MSLDPNETPAARRAKLIEALRAPMPPGHSWDFREVTGSRGCGTVGCALWFVEIFWPSSVDYKRPDVPELFDLTQPNSSRIFGVTSWGYDEYYECYKGDVTPQMVADALEAAPYASKS